MNFESIIWFILHYVLPYGIAFAILFWLIEFSFRAWIKANLDIAWSKVITWAVVIGLLAVIWAFWHWTVHPWLLKQAIWVMIASRINAVWQMLMQSPIMQTIHQKYLLISHWINAKIGDYRKVKSTPTSTTKYTTSTTMKEKARGLKNGIPG